MTMFLWFDDCGLVTDSPFVQPNYPPCVAEIIKISSVSDTKWWLQFVFGTTVLLMATAIPFCLLGISRSSND